MINKHLIQMLLKQKENKVDNINADTFKVQFTIDAMLQPSKTTMQPTTTKQITNNTLTNPTWTYNYYPLHKQASQPQFWSLT